jgi:hypothetical protein
MRGNCARLPISTVCLTSERSTMGLTHSTRSISVSSLSNQTLYVSWVLRTGKLILATTGGASTCGEVLMVSLYTVKLISLTRSARDSNQFNNVGHSFKQPYACFLSKKFQNLVTGVSKGRFA